MAASLNIDHLRIIHIRTDITITFSYLGKREQTVQTTDQVRIHLDRRNIFGKTKHQFVKETGFQRKYLLFRSQYLFFVFFQFFGNITFGIHQSLFAYPSGRDFVLVGVTHFDIIPENIVETDFKARYTRLFYFPLLYLQEIIFTRISDCTQLVKLGVHACRNHAAPVQQGRRIVVDLFFYPVTDQGTGIQLFADTAKARLIACRTSLLDRLDGTKGDFQLYHFAGRDATDRYFGNNTFQITDLFQLLFQQFFHFGMAEKIFHYVLALMDRFHILQREQYPTAQHTRSHRGNGLVQHIQQARPLLVHRADQLQATHRKLIEAYIAVFFDTGKRGDMRNMGVLRLIQIIQDGPRSYDSQFQMLDTETFQVLRFEMFQKTVVGSFRSKHPVIQFKNKEPRTESLFKTFTATPFDQYFFR